MVLKPLTPVITTPATPPWRSLDHYKRAKSTIGPHRPFFPSLPSSLTPSFTLAMSSSRHHSSPLSHRLFTSTHALVSTPLAPPRPPPLPSASTGKPQRPRAAPRQGAAIHSCPHRLGPWWTRAALPGPCTVDSVHALWTQSTRFSIEK
jgi:hypothetical protein